MHKASEDTQDTHDHVYSQGQGLNSCFMET